MDNEIRRARADDAVGVAEVHVRTWQDAYRGILPDDFLDALDVDRRVEAYEQRGVLTDDERPVYVLEEGGLIVGFANVGPSNDEPGVGELCAIYVSSAHWGTSVRRDLMSHAEAWLRARYPEATLWVLEENARARRFYEKCGWSTDGASKDDDRGSFVLREIRYRLILDPSGAADVGSPHAPRSR